MKRFIAIISIFAYWWPVATFARLQQDTTSAAFHLQRFRIDSSKGRYASALRHFRYYMAIQDSISDQVNSRDFIALQDQYETAKKVGDIAFLKKLGPVQESRLAQARITRNAIIAGAAMLFVLLALFYSRFRLGQRRNRKLALHQQEIDEKNRSLQQLLAEKDRLIEEKEWLVREVHHRVKNNLQVVMSLLNTQSAYLGNEAARNAIRDSQHRLRAVALIHQKLYQSDRMERIDMPVYVNELADHIREHDPGSSPLQLDVKIAPVALDVVQAVPVGLLINEVINHARERLEIQLRYEGPDELVLFFKGNILDCDSLGMNLVRGLAGQLGGELQIMDDNRLHLTVRFPLSKLQGYE